MDIDTLGAEIYTLQNEMERKDAEIASLTAERDALRAALATIVSDHDYKHLDMGIGTVLPKGKVWLEARRLVHEQLTRCTLDVGCDESGVCYAEAHDQPERCGRK